MALDISGAARVFYSQRVDGRPYVNCVPYSLCSVLAYMGYDVPADYGMEIRKASGVPVAEHRGTSQADMKRALGRILPNAPVVYGAVGEVELLNLLARAAKPNRGNVIAASFRMEKLPRNLRRHCGYTWEGLHSMTIHGRKRQPDGTWAVWIADPMGRPYRGYTGEWAPFEDIRPALKRNGQGLISVMYGARNSAV